MSGLSILGGVGEGLQRGAAFIHQARQQDAHMRRQDAQLQMNQERHAAWQQQQEREQKDRERLEGWNTLSTRIDTEYANLDPIDRNAMKIRYGVDTGLIAPSEFQALQQEAAQLRSAGLLDDILAGNLDGVARKFSERFGRPVTVATAKDANGRNVYRLNDSGGRTMRELTDEQLGVVLGMDRLVRLGEVERKGQEHALGVEKTRSEIGENQAQARAADALATQRRTAPATGSGATTGFSAATREEATRVALARKAAEGTATAQELDLLGVLEARAAEGDGYIPPAAKQARFWQNASHEQIETEVERRLADLKFKARASGDSFALRQLEDPATVEVLKADIRKQLSVARPAAKSQSTQRNLDAYFTE